MHSKVMLSQVRLGENMLVQVILDLVNHQIVNILYLVNIFLHAKTEITKYKFTK